MKVRAVGIAWYRQEDYAKIRKVMIDRRKLPDTYKQWLKKANQAFKILTTEDNLVEKIYIDPESFPDWCAKRGMNTNAEARTTFANESVAKKYGNQS